MTPLWLEAHATYIDVHYAVTTHQITFVGDDDIRQAQRYKAVLKVPLLAAGQLSDETPLTVNITVNTDVIIGQSSDSDPIFGLSDETNFIGFQTVDINNYPNYAPCFGIEGTSGDILKGTEEKEATSSQISDRFYPDEFVFTLKVHKLRGSCFTAQDGAYNKTALYSERLKLSNGLTLEIYKGGEHERVGIKYIEVIITKSSW